MSLRSKTISGAKWGLAQNAASQVLSLSVFLVLSRTLAPAEFGVFALAFAYVSLMIIIFSSGFETALIQRDNLEEEHLQSAFWFSVGFSLVLAIGSYFAAGWVARLFSAPALADVIPWFSMVIVINSPLYVQRALLRRSFRFKELSTRIMFSSLVANIVAVYMALTGGGIWSLVVRELVEALIVNTLLLVATKWRPQWQFSWPHFKELYSFGLSTMGNSIFQYVFRRSDNLIIGYFLGATLLGFYTVAYRVLELMIQITTRTIVSVSTPALARLQSDSTRFAEAVSRVSAVIGLVNIPAFAGLGALAPEVIPVLFGDKWFNSIEIMQILSVIGITQAQTHLLGSALVALGRPSLQLSLRVCQGLLSIGIVLLVVQNGIAAVAWVYSLVSLALLPAWYWSVNRLLKPAHLATINSLARILIACGVMVGVLISAQQFLLSEWSAWVRLVSLIILGGLTYIVMIVVLLPDSVNLVRSIVANKTKGEG